MHLERRAFGRALGAASVGLLFGVPSRASATLMRGLTLAQLVKTSSRVAIVTPLAANAHWQMLGGSRVIVTDTRVRVEESLRSDSSPPELLLRTLGGQVGDSGELVNGQPQLQVGETSVAFLIDEGTGLHWFMGMAQGHYPLRRAAGTQILTASRSLPQLMRFEGSAVQALNEQLLENARRLVLAAGAP